MSSFVTHEPVTPRAIRIAVALKGVAQHVEVDPLSGPLHVNNHLFGVSPADSAALEWALRMSDAWHGEVVAVTVGLRESEVMLRMALAAGATRAIRCELPLMASSQKVADALCDVLGDVDFVLCGDKSLDRGSGSVPAFIAARLGIAQALGVVALREEKVGVLVAERRVGRGRRERLRVGVPAVISVEGATARLRRASLSAVLATKGALIERVPMRIAIENYDHPGRFRPYRPRPATIAVPNMELGARERILAITNAVTARVAPQVLKMNPGEAADRIVTQLRQWGYLD